MIYWFSDVCRAFYSCFIQITVQTLSMRLYSALKKEVGKVMWVSYMPGDNTLRCRLDCDYLVVYGDNNEPFARFAIANRVSSAHDIVARLNVCASVLTHIERQVYSFGYCTEIAGKLAWHYTSRRHHLSTGDCCFVDTNPFGSSIKLKVSREMRCTYHVDVIDGQVIRFKTLVPKVNSLFKHAAFRGNRKPVAVEKVHGDERRVKVRFG